jgi:hypothetical protein
MLRGKTHIMDEELISKKELLETTNISYGQLYRWKRKNLIPVEWFIRKSAFTGQETFFPKQKILARIEKIKNMKDDSSLTELADVFSPSTGTVSPEKKNLIDRGIISKPAMEIIDEKFGQKDRLSFRETLYAYALEKALNAGDIGRDEARLLLDTLDGYFPKFEGKNCSAYVFRKMGTTTCCVLQDPAEIYFDAGTKAAASLNLAALAEELKIKL